MLLELRAEVESATILKAEYRFSFEDKHVSLIPAKNKDGRDVVAAIVITKRIPSQTNLKTSFNPPPNRTEPGEIRIGDYGSIFKELTLDLQFLESLLSLYGVTRIDWN